MPYQTIPYHTMPYQTIPDHTIPYHTAPYHINLQMLGITFFPSMIILKSTEYTTRPCQYTPQDRTGSAMLDRARGEALRISRSGRSGSMNSTRKISTFIPLV